MTGRRVLSIVVGVLVLLALTTTVAWAANGEPTDEGAEPVATTSDALLIALAPIVTIATAIERVLEMLSRGGVERFIVVAHPDDDSLVEHLRHPPWVGRVRLARCRRNGSALHEQYARRPATTRWRNRASDGPTADSRPLTTQRRRRRRDEHRSNGRDRERQRDHQ